jgi:hypothetical protein
MDPDFYRQQNEGIRECWGKEFGVDPAAFAREEVTFVPRPEPPLWPYTAQVLGFGTGTVLVVDQRYMDWAREHAPAPHYRLNYNGFLYPFVQEGKSRGEKLAAIQPGLGWALGSRPAELPVPAGLRMVKVDSAWMAAVAGAFDTSGMLEIGIDVVRSHRGRSLAPVVVAAAARDILSQHRVPFYACATTNIRSQRTALASGFIPACSMALVVPADMGE